MKMVRFIMWILMHSFETEADSPCAVKKTKWIGKEAYPFSYHKLNEIRLDRAMQSFPNPLSAKEEGELLKRKEDADETARQLLIEHNLRLVAHIVKKYHATVKESEDLLSIGTIGLIKAIDTFRMDRGIRLATYASRCIENAILSQMRFYELKKSAGITGRKLLPLTSYRIWIL